MGVTGKTAVRFAAGACFVLIACRSKSPAGPGAVSSAPSAATPSSAAPAASAAPNDDTWHEAGIRKFVERWVAAQSQVDFAAYERLYAPKFSGVKRVGSHTEWFGRKGWMRDRQAMFKPGLRVEATDVSVVFASSAARARFTQSFTLGNFHDVGRKELLVVKGPDGPLVAREEMLVSKVDGAKPSGDGGLGGPGAYAVFEDSVYIGAGIGEDATTGAPALSTAKVDSYNAEMTVDTQRLAPSLRSLAGRTLKLVGVDGPICEAHVRDFVVRASGEPHFGMAAAWRGLDGTGSPPWSDAAIARDFWSMFTPDQRYLVARLDRACAHALLAFEDTVPARVKPSMSTEPLRGIVLSAFRKLDEYKTIQQEFDQETPKSGARWDEKDAHIDVSEFSPPSGRKVVVVSASGGPRGPAGCGEFWGALSVRFEIDESGSAPRIVRTDVLETSDGLTPKVAFDADGDGSLDLLTGPDGFNSSVVLWRTRPKTIVSATLLSAAYMDCPC